MKNKRLNLQGHGYMNKLLEAESLARPLPVVMPHC